VVAERPQVELLYPPALVVHERHPVVQRRSEAPGLAGLERSARADLVERRRYLGVGPRRGRHRLQPVVRGPAAALMEGLMPLVDRLQERAEAAHGEARRRFHAADPGVPCGRVLDRQRAVRTPGRIDAGTW